MADDFNICRLDSVESTNRYCEALDIRDVEDFACYWTLNQTAGIGQRGNHWHSSPGCNLTFSLVLKPASLRADAQFRLTQAISLAICDLLRPILTDGSFSSHSISIKWPNDIYVGNRKICGTLTSASIAGGMVASAVCGIGLNVNECLFPDWIPNPTSLALLTGHSYDLEPLLQRLLYHLRHRYDALSNGTLMQTEYLSLLYRNGVEASYLYEGTTLRATIFGVDNFGRLLLSTVEGQQLCCGMKEIAFVL